MPDSLYKQAIDAVVSTIQGLSLTGVENTEIAARRWPWDGDHVFRGITVHPQPEVEAPGTNERDDIGYSIGVTMVVARDVAGTENRDYIPAWRQAIRRAFHNERLAGVTETGSHHLICSVIHGDIDRTGAPRGMDRYEVSTLIVRFWMREKRT